MKIQTISAGRDRSIALAADGSAYGWGNIKRMGATLPAGYPGELCTSSPTEIGHNRFAQPLPQWLNPGVPFVTVSDGYAETLAIGKNGTVLICQPVVSQENGAAHIAMDALPTAPAQVTSTELAAFAVYADGTVWSWGAYARVQLGRVAASTQSLPAKVSLPSQISVLATGQGHVLALDRHGAVWTWGANAAGQLGLGDLTERTRPVKVGLPTRIAHVAAGDTHSFALDESGQLWAWGANNFGQLGPIAPGVDKAAKFLARPAQVRPGFPISQIDAGMFYTAATSTQGDVFAWGWNGLGQLGREGVAASSKPVRLIGLANVTRIAAGQAHVLALNPSGVSAWGDNRASACGTAPLQPAQFRPVPIDFS